MKQKNMNQKTELEITLSICKWLRNEGYLFYCDIAAGLKLTNYQAMLVSRMRWGRGLPDLIIFEPHEYEGKKYCGYAIELKKSLSSVFKKDGSYRNDKHIQEQVEVLKMLEERGWRTSFADSVETIKTLLNNQN